MRIMTRSMRWSAIAATGMSLTACGPTGSSENPQSAGAAAPKVLSAAHLGGLKAGEASPAGRIVIGRGKDYEPIAEDSAGLAARLEKSMAERRQIGWRIVEAMLQPQPLTLGGQEFQVPLWHTWYEGTRGNAEVPDKIKLFFAKLKACRASNCPKTMEQIAAETVADNDVKDLGLSLTDENLVRMAPGQASGSPHDDLGRGGTLFSPSFVEHILSQARQIEGCPQLRTDESAPGPSPTQFSHCLAEFPRSAVMVKTAWKELDQGVPAPATDSGAMTTLISAGTWPKPPPMAAPGPDKIYTVESTGGQKYGLRAIHFSTKDIREWIWVSLWWSPNPNSDFGQDRPASIARYNGGVWANYKMCVTTSFVEGDPAPWAAFEQGQPQLAAALKASHQALVAKGAASPDRQKTTWCSNPDIETDDNNGATNCIGCHQYAASWDPDVNQATHFSFTLDPSRQARYPQFSRSRRRNNFPSDFTWTFRHEGTPQIIRRERERPPRLDW